MLPFFHQIYQSDLPLLFTVRHFYRSNLPLLFILKNLSNTLFVVEFFVTIIWPSIISNHIEIVFCCVVACIQPDFFGCQQDFLVVWRWNQLRTFLGIFENNFTDFQEAVSLEIVFKIVQENILKCSKLIHF